MLVVQTNMNLVALSIGSLRSENMLKKPLFDYIAKEYKNIMQKNGQSKIVISELKKLQKEFNIEPEVILDVGIGSGLTCKGYLSYKTKKVYGVEPSKEMISNFKCKDKRIKCFCKDFESFDFNKKVNATYLILTIPFLKDWKNCLKKTAKITEDYIIILEQEIPKKDFKNLGKGFSIKDEIKDNYTPVTVKEITSVLKTHKFNPIIKYKKELKDIKSNSVGNLNAVVYSK
ncbi:MAG: hypothetical protein COT14_01180 [Candidatus Diapherotrites archaeon CG08_land_8_20_14_0_20_30_16]|nr:MAG: hypothetical protein COT14_01180 [Candidatus Diapherotrites archaeon CG08_land_8_20_14_0_20_30_16]